MKDYIHYFISYKGKKYGYKVFIPEKLNDRSIELILNNMEQLLNKLKQSK